MADKVKHTRELKLLAKFADGDDRTITIPTKKQNITKSDVTALNFSASYVLVGDKNYGKWKSFESAQVHESTKVYLDLTTD